MHLRISSQARAAVRHMWDSYPLKPQGVLLSLIRPRSRAIIRGLHQELLYRSHHLGSEWSEMGRHPLTNIRGAQRTH